MRPSSGHKLAFGVQLDSRPQTWHAERPPKHLGLDSGAQLRQWHTQSIISVYISTGVPGPQVGYEGAGGWKEGLKNSRSE